LNDDELNIVISRSDEEIGLYRDMDVQRERDTLEAWRAAGHRGRPPQNLMQLDELPECYQNDEPFEVKEVDEAMEGRGQRRRNVVSYNDGLSDEQWAIVSMDSKRTSSIYLIRGHRHWRREKICKSSRNVLETRKNDVRRINSSRTLMRRDGVHLFRIRRRVAER
jgi:hypothetical protein